MRHSRTLILALIAVTTLFGLAAPVAAQEAPPTVQVPFDIVTTMDLTRPPLRSQPYLSSGVIATSTDGRFLLVRNSYGTSFSSTEVISDYSRFDLATGDQLHFSPTWNGEPLSRYVKSLAMSDDGQHLVFATDSNNVIFGGVDNGHGYHFDLTTMQPQLITLRPDGTHGRYTPDDMTITPDGRYVVLSSAAGLTPEHRGGVVHVYRWDRLTGTTELVSRNADGAPANISSASSLGVVATRPSVSDDGRFVAFVAYSTNLVAEELPGANTRNFQEKAYLKDLLTGEVTLLSRDASGPLDVKALDVGVTGDGSAVVYNSFPFGENGTAWRWDRSTGERTLLMTGDESLGYASFTGINADGTTLHLGYTGEHYRDQTVLRFVAQGEPPPTSGSAFFGVIDRFGLWAVRGRTDEAGNITPLLDVATRSIVPETQETCGGPELRYAADARPLDDQILRLYQAVFGRAPDADGLDYWIRQRIAGASMEAIAAEFTRSTEWADRYGSDASVDEVITLLYSNVLDRDPDDEGFAFWRESGLDVPQLIVSFSDSEENVTRTSTAPPMSAAQGAVCRLYLGVFDRAPDAEGFEFWTGRIEGGQSVQSVAAEFTASPEWTQTYGANPSSFSLVTGLYGNVFSRTADIGGLRFWVGLSDEGVTDPALLEQFIQSAEFIGSTGTAP